MTYRPEHEPDSADDWDDDRAPQQHGRIGAVLLTIGLLLVVERIAGVDVNMLRLAGGIWFLLKWRRDRALWKLLVGVFLVLTPIATLLAGLGGAAGGSEVMFPVFVMAAGGLMVFRKSLPQGATGALWMVVIVSLVLAVAGDIGWDDRRDDNPAIFINRGPRATRPELRLGGNLPSLDGKMLVINAGGNDIDVRLVADPAPLADAVKIVDAPGTVVLDVTADDTDIELPNGTDVQIVSRGGDVRLAVTGDPTVDLTTSGGTIDLDGFDGVEEDPERAFHHAGASAQTIRITTESGDIDLERTAAKLR